MELFASSTGLFPNKPWAAGVAKNALSRVSEFFCQVSATHRFNVAICFDDAPDAVPRLVICEHSDDSLHLSIFFPAATWHDRVASRPLAESAIVSCLFAAAEQLGISSGSVLQCADAAGIDINVAEVVASDSGQTTELQIETGVDSLFTSATNELGPLGQRYGG